MFLTIDIYTFIVDIVDFVELLNELNSVHIL